MPPKVTDRLADVLTGGQPAPPTIPAPAPPADLTGAGAELQPAAPAAAPPPSWLEEGPGLAASTGPVLTPAQATEVGSRLREPVKESEVEKIPGLQPDTVTQLEEQGQAVGQPTLRSIFGKERGDMIREHIALGFPPEVVARAAVKSLADWYSPAMLAVSAPGRIAHGYAAAAQAAEKAGMVVEASKLAGKARLAGALGTATGAPIVGSQVHDLVENWDNMSVADRTAAISGIVGGTLMTGVGIHAGVTAGKGPKTSTELGPEVPPTGADEDALWKMNVQRVRDLQDLGYSNQDITQFNATDVQRIIKDKVQAPAPEAAPSPTEKAPEAAPATASEAGAPSGKFADIGGTELDRRAPGAKAPETVQPSGQFAAIGGRDLRSPESWRPKGALGRTVDQTYQTLREQEAAQVTPVSETAAQIVDLHNKNGGSTFNLTQNQSLRGTDLGTIESSRAQKVRERAQEARWNAQAKGEPEGVTNRQKYIQDIGGTKGTSLMSIPQSLMTVGGTPHDVGTHELAHAVVADMTGVPTEGSVVRSHMHPDELGKGAAAAWQFDISKMPGTTKIPHGPPGVVRFSPSGLAAAWPKFLKTYLAGGVAQELVHGMPFEENEGVQGDLGVLRRIGEMLDQTPEETQGMIDGALQETRELLNHPAILDILKTNAGVREEGLSKTLLHSAAKVQDVIRQVREVQSGRADDISAKQGDVAGAVGGARTGAGEAVAGGPGEVQGGAARGDQPIQGTIFAKKVKSEEPTAIDRIRAELEKDKNEDTVLRAPDKFSPAQIDRNGTFLLSDGSAVSSPSAEMGQEGVIPHDDTRDAAGHDNLEQAKAIRIETPRDFELFTKPTEQQREQIARLWRAIGKKNLTWDFADGFASGDIRSSGVGTLGEFLRAVDAQYKTAEIPGTMESKKAETEQQALPLTSLKIIGGNHEDFQTAVKNTPFASFSEKGLTLSLTRYQKPEQAGEVAGRGGVFHLAGEGGKSAYARRTAYGKPVEHGGPEEMRGRTTFVNPLIVKGGFGGSIQKAFYDAFRDETDALAKLHREAFQAAEFYKDDPAGLAEFIEREGGDSQPAYDIWANSTTPHQVATAIYDNVMGKMAKDMGHDAIVGYYKKPGGGYQFSEVFDLTADEFPSVSPPKGATTLLQKHPLLLEGTGEGGRTTIFDFAKAINEWAQQGLKPKKEIRIALERGRAEMTYQLAQDNSGTGWYKTDVKDAIGHLKTNGFPELEDPTQDKLFRTMWGITSYGVDPDINMTSAAEAYKQYKQTGTMPLMADSKTNWPGYSGIKGSITLLNKLIEEKGEQGTIDWLTSKHPVSDIREQELKTHTVHGVAGKAEDEKYGAFIFGPKGGPYVLSLQGITDHTTVDVWGGRMIRRWTGTLTPESMDQPVTAVEAQKFHTVVEKLGKEFGLDISDAQAVLWGYEHDLYKAHGVGEAAKNYKGAAEKYVQRQQEGNTREYIAEQTALFGERYGTPVQKAAGGGKSAATSGSLEGGQERGWKELSPGLKALIAPGKAVK